MTNKRKMRWNREDEEKGEEEMNREEIIRMAREAGYGLSLSDMHAPALERFANLVAAAEREAFVALVYEMDGPDGIVPTDDLLAAIRARGEE